MKILILSDFCWSRNLKKITNEDVDNFKEIDLEGKKFEGIKKYSEIIKTEKANLVLFAGDVTGDGSCGHGFQNSMKILLKILEAEKIQSYFISGNHDEHTYYTDLINYSKTLKYSEDISNRSVTFKGLEILGISYGTSYSKTRLRKLISNNSHQIDIVISHAELRRRTWLFDLETDFIVTGHFDRKLASIDNRIFISLDNDSNVITYCTLEKNEKNNWNIQYIIKGTSKSFDENIIVEEQSKDLLSNSRNGYYTVGNKQKLFSTIENSAFLSYKEVARRISNGDKESDINFEKQMDFLGLKHIRGNDLTKGIERIRKFKKNKVTVTESRLSEVNMLEINSRRGISKEMVIDYVGKNLNRR